MQAYLTVDAIFQDGDYVWAHTDYILPGWGPMIGFDIFRFENGLIVEHWDNLQTTAGPNPSDHSMTDGPTRPTDLELTDHNRGYIRKYVEEVLVGGNNNLLMSYYFGNNYIQHNPWIGDGLTGTTGLFQGVAALAKAGHAVKYTKLRQVLAEGDFVLVTSEGLFGNQVTAYYDMMRVEHGKIAEHWDVLQPIPAREHWRNDNGKF
ncbi:hypothetical protein BV898_10211 [Hypsibius exemplaris]|uniref:SnoaL-like domain-containing protein n=1 Tax=Hypsibius exemplaris TaxID=2072580 RepID=A0A1W0WKC6_HYPEX|nr:hypothetical protein BV898_10211 [Hypsibius exemplaris]